jgi:hypothetical protein
VGRSAVRWGECLQRVPTYTPTILGVAGAGDWNVGGGKSTLLEELALWGHTVVDTDYDGWILDDGRWDELRMHELLAHADNVVVSATVENQGRFLRLFRSRGASLPLQTLLDRVAEWSSNPYGKRPDEHVEIPGYLETVEPLLRRGATFELDGRAERIRWSQPSRCSCRRSRRSCCLGLCLSASCDDSRPGALR